MDNSTNSTNPFEKFGFRLSLTKKKANDYKVIKEIGEHFINLFSPMLLKEERRKLRINYNLFNGRNPSLDDYKDFFSQYNYGNESSYTEAIAHFDQIEHHPIMDQIAKALVGERRRRKLNPAVKDISLTANNQRKQKETEMIKQLFNSMVILPLKRQVAQQMGVDPEKLNPDQQKELQGQIDQQAQTMVLEDIKDYMENDFYLQTDLQGQRLLEYWMNFNKIEEKTVEGFKHGLISGKEIYSSRIINKKPVVKLANPMGIRYGMPSDSNNIEDAEWVVYEDEITIGQIFNEYGTQLKTKHLKKLDEIASKGITGSFQNQNSSLQSTLVSVISADPRVQRGEIDQRNSRGQEYLRNLYARYGDNATVKIRRTHVCFRLQAEMYYVHHQLEDGSVGWEFMGENYTPNPLTDSDWKSVWLNQIWEFDKIGEGDSAIYMNIGPVEGQYNSNDDPFNPKMPYVGSEYSRLMGNSKNVSVMDLGKPWQYKFNVQMARIQELEATNIGKVLLMVQQAMPKDWDPIDFYGHIRRYKIGLLDVSNEAYGRIDPNLIKSVDMSNTAEMGGMLQYLEFLKDNLAKSMYYNPSRLGQISPYLPVTNNQQNIIQSSTQTEDLFSVHNDISERLLTSMLDNARICYYQDPKEYTYILDEISMASLNVEPELMKSARLGVKVTNPSEDEQNLQASKQLLPYFLNSQTITFEDAMRLLWAKTGSEAINIAKKSDKKRDGQQEGQQQKEAEMLQIDQQYKDKLFQQQAALQLQLKNMEVDLDGNQRKDGMDETMAKLEYQRDKDAKDRALEREKNNLDARLAEKELEVQRKQNAYRSKN